MKSHSQYWWKNSLLPNVMECMLLWVHNSSLRSQRVILNGERSKILISIVPQGLTLFLVFINELPSEVGCQIALFAYDTLNTILFALMMKLNLNKVCIFLGGGLAGK